MSPRELIKPRVVAPGAGEIIGDSPDRRVEMLSDCDELHATWSRFGPGRDGAGLHIHHEHSDLFYVLEGELTVRTGKDSSLVASTGTLVLIPPMVVHGFRNASDADVKYLNFHAPGCGFADYMRGLRDKQPVDFDQHEPEGEGLLPASAISVSWALAVTLCDVDAITVVETVVKPGASPVVRAAGPRGSGVESFYVLEGDVAFELKDREGVAAPGTWFQTPVMAASGLSFPEDAGARWLTIST